MIQRPPESIHTASRCPYTTLFRSCPVPVKQAIVDWWGPVLFEYYAGSEGNGMTFISSADWLTHRGSVGRPILGAIHIMGEDNETELAPNEIGRASCRERVCQYV